MVGKIIIRRTLLFRIVLWQLEFLGWLLDGNWVGLLPKRTVIDNGKRLLGDLFVKMFLDIRI